MKSAKDIKRLKALGAHVRLLREAERISQDQLAFESKLTKSQIGRIERGEIATSVTNLFLIADALNIEPKELLNFEIPYKKS